MDKELIERLAEEAGFLQAMGASHIGVAPTPEAVRRFAALIAEGCAKLCETPKNTSLDGNDVDGVYCARAIRQAFKAE